MFKLPWLLLILTSNCALAAAPLHNTEVTTSAAQPKAAMTYRYWDWGKTPKRDDYQLSVLRTALEKTQKEYGSFTIIRHQELYTTSRLRREINRGLIVNVHVGPWRPLETDAAKLSERSIRIDIPIMNGLLGYRQLIIRKENSAIFQNLNVEKDLKNMTAGQARGWRDIEIFRHNGYKVDSDANLTSLFAMLSGKRFDYLPMSVAEAESAIAATPQYQKEFTIVPDIIIYYPFPIHFYVSPQEPKMAERLLKGLEIAEKDGSLALIFHEFFAKEIAAIKKQKPRYVVLENPFIPDALRQPKALLLEH